MNTSSETLSGNFWSAGRETTSQPPLDRELDCDFLIVGGGFSGLSTALHLKQERPTARIALLDASKIGNGASGLNSGQCSTRIGPPIEKQVRSLNQEQAADIYQYSLEAMEYAASFINAYGIQCDLQAGKQWQVALTKKDLKILVNRALLYQSLGFDVPLISRHEIEKKFPNSTNILSAIEFPAYMFDPYKLCLGLKQKVLQAGVHLYENTKVISRKVGKQLIELNANGHLLHYQHAILAVDGGIDKLSEYSASVLPISVFAAVTRPLEHHEKKHLGWLEKQGLFDTRPAFNFLRPLDGDRILIGGEYRYLPSNQINTRQQQKILQRLGRQLGFFFPFLQHIDFEYQWHGTVGCTLDEWPAIGPLKSNGKCWYLGASNGHGVATSLIAGREVARAVASNKIVPRFPWYRSSIAGLGHPVLSHIALPQYLTWLRVRSRLDTQYGDIKNVLG